MDVKKTNITLACTQHYKDKVAEEAARRNLTVAQFVRDCIKRQMPREDVFDSHLHEKAVDAAVRMLGVKGYEVIDRGYATNAGVIDIVAKNDGRLVFIDVAESKGEGADYKPAKYDRKTIEVMSTIYFAENSTRFKDNTAFRYDSISIRVLDTGHATVRHHINCFDGNESKVA